MHPGQVFVLLLLFAQGTGWFSVSCTARKTDGRSVRTSSARSTFNFIIIRWDLVVFAVVTVTGYCEKVRENDDRTVIQQQQQQQQ